MEQDLEPTHESLETPTESLEAQPDADVFSGKKKKKKTPKVLDVEESSLGTSVETTNEEDASYLSLLSRFYAIMKEENPELVGDKKKYTIVPPQVIREGSKKTAFTNYQDICKRMRRLSYRYW